MTKQAGLATIAFLLAALGLPATPARAQAVESSPHPAQENDSAGTAHVGHTGADFYRDLDRPDLAKRYERRQAWKEYGSTVGSLTLAAGLVWGVVDLVGTGMHNSFLGGRQRSVSPYPWVTAGAGLGLLITSERISADPLNGDERRLLIDAYNRKKLALVPQLGPGSAGLMMAGRF